MCGILALARGTPAEQEVVGARALERAMARLRRRGPDGEGAWSSPCRRVLLGHTRLAIQDLSDAGRQPMADDPANPRVVVTYNGEIYNAPALRRELEQAGVVFRSRSDTEVLVYGLGRWGWRGLLERLRGMFALVLVDRRDPARPVLHAAVDHAGMKPLCWSHSAGGGQRGARVGVASDVDALLALLGDEPDFAPRLDGQGLAHVLSLGYCPAPWTVWRGIRKLGPGQCLMWVIGDPEPPRVETWWSPPEAIDTAPGRDDPEAFAAALREVVDDHMLSDVPVGLFLSAGIDSSSLALALAQAGRASDITAFTLKPEGIDPLLDEAPPAAELAGAMMMRHRVVPLAQGDLRVLLGETARACDEPQGFTALLTAMRIASQTRAGGGGPKVVIGGDGGDEAFGGYAWHTSRPHPLSVATAPAPSAKEVAEHGALAARLAGAGCDGREREFAAHALGGLSYTHRLLARIFGGFHPAESRALLAGLGPEYDEDVYAGWLAPHDRPGLPHPRRAQRLDLLGFCAGSIMPKVDRTAMSVGLEVRAPLLDRRMLEWGLAGPVLAGEVEPGAGKAPLRGLLRRGVDAGLVPAAVLLRPKQGFSLRLGEERPYEQLAAEVLPESRLVRDGVVRRDYAAYLPAGVEAREARLFTLCLLAAWYEARVA